MKNSLVCFIVPVLILCALPSFAQHRFTHPATATTTAAAMAVHTAVAITATRAHTTITVGTEGNAQ